jgi:outer membrane lipopolysaccharide assembly protein LptE/RlpB
METLSQSRTLPINSGEVLAGSNQAAALFQQMRRAVVFDIMNRLSSQYVTHILSQSKTTP